MQSHTLDRIVEVSVTLHVLRHSTLERAKIKPALYVFAFPACYPRTFRIPDLLPWDLTWHYFDEETHFTAKYVYQW